MKKYLLASAMIVLVLALSNCHTKKVVVASPAPRLTYENKVQSVIMDNCSPCHIPSKGGNKKAYDNYASASADIDEIIRRIELNPTDRGFMPFRHPKLPDSTIAVFKLWKTDGTPER